MPYIKQQAREFIASEKSLDCPTSTEHPGNLNYVITLFLKEYASVHGHNYRTYNEIVGVLECAKLEFYRRAVAAYEDTKIEENGDVY